MDDRLQLYAYLQPREYHRTYLAIMRLFASTLLADLSAGEVAATLAAAERDGLIEPGESQIDNVITRLRQLVDWGNLVPGRREVVAASIAEFQHGSVRYQISKLAIRVQRDVDELLRVPEGAREVSRELLPAIDRGLRQLSASLAGRTGSESIAEQVTTLFLQHAELAVTVRDFYAYLGQVVTRYQLAPAEISGFRDILVDYIQLVVEDVLRYTPTIADTLISLRQQREELLRLLSADDGLGKDAERARGRSDADWREFTDWFADRAGSPSQVTALREATGKAISSLLATVKRATSSAEPLPSRRSELLALAARFDQCSQEQAHSLYANVFGLYSARNLLPAPEHDGDDEHTPWRDGPAVDVTVSVRSRADRGARGRTSRIMDDPITELALVTEAKQGDTRRSTAVAELMAVAPRITESALSTEALDVLRGLLTSAMAQRDSPQDPGSAADPVHGLRLTLVPDPGKSTTIATEGGTLVVHDAAITLEAAHHA